MYAPACDCLAGYSRVFLLITHAHTHICICVYGGVWHVCIIYAHGHNTQTHTSREIGNSDNKKYTHTRVRSRVLDAAANDVVGICLLMGRGCRCVVQFYIITAAFYICALPVSSFFSCYSIVFYFVLALGARAAQQSMAQSILSMILLNRR